MSSILSIDNLNYEVDNKTFFDNFNMNVEDKSFTKCKYGICYNLIKR